MKAEIGGGRRTRSCAARARDACGVGLLYHRVRSCNERTNERTINYRLKLAGGKVIASHALNLQGAGKSSTLERVDAPRDPDRASISEPPHLLEPDAVFPVHLHPDLLRG